MEKLLNLLNEFKEGKSFKFTKYDEKYWIFDTDLNRDGNTSLPEETIICKKFWFIQWLMDQNKVEFDRARDRSDFPLLYAGWWGFYSDADIIVATLSIQDDPISFLISILK